MAIFGPAALEPEGEGELDAGDYVDRYLAMEYLRLTTLTLDGTVPLVVVLTTDVIDRDDVDEAETEFADEALAETDLSDSFTSV
jgi:hypothetical protein